MQPITKQTILVKVETIVGTDAVPTPASDAMEVYNFTMNPSSDTVTKTPNRQFFGADEVSYTNKRQDISFDIYMTGSGTVDGIPPHDPIYKACKLVGTENTGVSYQYDPDSEATTTATIYFYQNGVLFKALGASGTINNNTAIGDFLKATVTMVGVYVTPADAAPAGTPDYSSFQTPIVCTKDNSVCSVHGTNAEGRSFSFTLGNVNEFRESTETKAIAYLDRKPSANITAWFEDMADFNPYALWESEARGISYWELNGGVGNTIRITMPQTQLANPGIQDDQSITGLSFDLTPHPTSSGSDDEVQYIFS